MSPAASVLLTEALQVEVGGIGCSSVNPIVNQSYKKLSFSFSLVKISGTIKAA